MSSKTVLAMVACAALGLAAAGCNNDNTNANTNTTNANANRATNANTTNANANTTNANANGANWNMTREEYNKNANNYRAEAKNKGESIGESLEDGWIHFKVRAALAAVDDLRDSTINVDVDKNVVTLRGTVPGADQKKKAEDAAKKVEGVKSVTDKLEVKAAAGANSNARSPANSNK
jgi:hyperosmotically inducible periplasmic protein